MSLPPLSTDHFVLLLSFHELSRSFYLTQSSVATMVTGKEGEAIASRLWKELMDELAFANVNEILRATKE